jgi:hypothetical protein
MARELIELTSGPPTTTVDEVPEGSILLTVSLKGSST